MKSLIVIALLFAPVSARATSKFAGCLQLMLTSVGVRVNQLHENRDFRYFEDAEMRDYARRQVDDTMVGWQWKQMDDDWKIAKAKLAGSDAADVLKAWALMAPSTDEYRIANYLANPASATAADGPALIAVLEAQRLFSSSQFRFTSAYFDLALPDEDTRNRPVDSADIRRRIWTEVSRVTAVPDAEVAPLLRDLEALSRDPKVGPNLQLILVWNHEFVTLRGLNPSTELKALVTAIRRLSSLQP